MNGDWILLLPVCIPIILGLLLANKRLLQNRTARAIYVAVASFLTLVFILLAAGFGTEFTLFAMGERLRFVLRPDKLSILFGALSSVMWLSSAVYSKEYMEKERDERFYQSFYLLSLGAVVALCLSGNLVTMYLFYEIMTLCLVPLVVQERTKEAIHAGFEFLFYSVGGAFLGLAGLFIFYSCGIDMDFHDGARLVQDATMVQTVAQNRSLLLLGAFLTIVGFGSKAGLFPLHGWLPVAHPVAPAPASALLSGNVTKMGVLLILRVIYYVLGPDFLRGTWVQYTCIGFALITVFMGSVLAAREKLLKKRLAYSTVSQVSYALFGILLMNPLALFGALLHVVFHSVVKNTLFLTAGAFIHQTGRTRVDELRGIGKKMPWTLWMYTLVSITLIGIPPTSAFLSKWYLAQGALESGILVVNYLGPVVLLVSAVFTAGYLLPITIRGFLPGAIEEQTDEEPAADMVPEQTREVTPWMLVPMCVLTIAAVGFGMFPGALSEFILSICRTVL